MATQVNPAAYVVDATTNATSDSPLRTGNIIRELAMVALMPGARLSISNEASDRRMFPRREVSARIEGRRLDHSIEARQQPQLSLMLRDVSLGGLSAITNTPIARGERISVFFPPQGPARGWDAYGRIIRCDPSPAGFRIAVSFDPLPAA